ncbi:peptide deformylase [Actinotalea sp. BY-33]|uniref:Peptide deformylase n=1 Tax=Actinotalea soli TaxID=2819234 RepID=A0A939LUD8_9CELL|nr:peptide deformylase [Actinotalea soli]MBO1752314.1 peptide deformylase [Actinotalea soli]
MSAHRALLDQVDALLEVDGPLPIVQAGDPVLRRPAARYDGQLDDARLSFLLAAMRRTMREAPGVGLAAPQVGLSLAVAVLEDGWPVDDEHARAREREPLPFRVLVNPAYTPHGTERVAFYEGCLSVHGWQAVTSRWRTVHLTGSDEHGHPLDELVHGWPARIVQHETDHLGGRLYVDQAEMRSLTGPDHALRWADPTPERAAQELGFPLA